MNTTAPFPTFDVIARDLATYSLDVRALHPDQEPSTWRLDEAAGMLRLASVDVAIVPERRSIVGRALVDLNGWQREVTNALERVRDGYAFTNEGFAGWDRGTSEDGHEALCLRLGAGRAVEQCDRSGCVGRGEWFPLEDEHGCSSPRTLALVDFSIYVDFDPGVEAWRVHGTRYDTYSAADAREFAEALHEAANIADDLNAALQEPTA
ncbi:MAG: hypothetical protein ACTH31_09960 [Pseudoclavibacter sp.]